MSKAEINFRAKKDSENKTEAIELYNKQQIDVSSQKEYPFYIKNLKVDNLEIGGTPTGSGDGSVDSVALNSHVSNKSNPHGVTASQVGAATSSHNHDGTYAKKTDLSSSITSTNIKSPNAVQFVDGSGNAVLSKSYVISDSSIEGSDGNHSISLSWDKKNPLMQIDNSVRKLSLDGHTHTGYASSSHNHSASNITSGTIPLERGGTGVSMGTTNKVVYVNSGISGSDNATNPHDIALSWNGSNLLVSIDNTDPKILGYKSHSHSGYASSSHTHGFDDISVGEWQDLTLETGVTSVDNSSKDSMKIKCRVDGDIVRIIGDITVNITSMPKLLATLPIDCRPSNNYLYFDIPTKGDFVNIGKIRIGNEGHIRLRGAIDPSTGGDLTGSTDFHINITFPII